MYRVKPGTVAHICNPSYSGSWLEATVGKKVKKTPFQPINQVWQRGISRTITV
jgi:hypothetical protein